MDYYLLTDMAAQIGYELAVSGAETFRIEETMRRVLAAYGICCETFAIFFSPARRSFTQRSMRFFGEWAKSMNSMTSTS